MGSSVDFKGLKLGNAQEFHLEPTNERTPLHTEVQAAGRIDARANEGGGGGRRRKAS